MKSSCLEFAKQRPFVFHQIKCFPDIEQVYRRIEMIFKVTEAASQIDRAMLKPDDVIPRIKEAINAIEEKLFNNIFDAATILEVCPKVAKEQVKLLVNGLQKPLLKADEAGDHLSS
jgi:cob(I)alamin adenosyltransferase